MILVLPILLRIPIVSSVLRPLTAHFIRGPWTLILPLRYFSLEFRTFILANWEFSEALFDFHIPQVHTVFHRVSHLLIHLPSSQSTSHTPPPSQTRHLFQERPLPTSSFSTLPILNCAVFPRTLVPLAALAVPHCSPTKNTTRVYGAPLLVHLSFVLAKTTRHYYAVVHLLLPVHLRPQPPLRPPHLNS